MKSFYNIIKIASNPTVDESIAIGLIAFSNSRFFVRFSDRKKRIAKTLIGSSSDLVDYLPRQIMYKINMQNSLLENDLNSLFKTKPDINTDYCNYLSRYSNNILQFSDSFELNNSIDEKGFDKLFSLLIDNSTPEQPIKENYISNQFYHRIKKKLIDPVKDIVHTNIKLNEIAIPSLYFNYEMDCIGMNGVITGAKSIDFNKSDPSIDKLLSHYFQVSMLLAKNYQKNKKENNFYIIGDEPNGRNIKIHKIWEHINKQKIFTVINSEEADIVTKKIEETNASTFLSV